MPYAADGSPMTPDQALDALMEGNRRYLDTSIAPVTPATRPVNSSSEVPPVARTAGVRWVRWPRPRFGVVPRSPPGSAFQGWNAF